jgi:hypothetical protein
MDELPIMKNAHLPRYAMYIYKKENSINILELDSPNRG